MLGVKDKREADDAVRAVAASAAAAMPRGVRVVGVGGSLGSSVYRESEGLENNKERRQQLQRSRNPRTQGAAAW